MQLFKFFEYKPKEKLYTTSQVVEILDKIYDPSIHSYQYYETAIKKTITTLRKLNEKI